MKRFCILLIILALFCAAAFAEGGGADFEVSGGTSGTILSAIQKTELRTGPGYEYDVPELSMTDLAANDTVVVLSQVYSYGERWVLAEISTFEGPARCYLLAVDSLGNQSIRYDTAAVPWEAGPSNLISVWGCMAYRKVALRFGPGDTYAYTGTFISHDDTAWVIMRNGNWVMVEISNRFDDTGSVYAFRGWVPFDELIY